MNRRAGLVLIGAAVAIVGYAVVYSGLSTLNPSITPSGAPIGVLDALVPSVDTFAPAAPDGGHHRRRRRRRGGGGKKK